MRNGGLHKSARLASATIALALAFSAAARAADYDSVCGDVEGQSQQSNLQNLANGNANTSQKASYCQAAKDAQSGAKVDGVLWKVWAGVAAACIPACATSAVG